MKHKYYSLRNIFFIIIPFSFLFFACKQQKKAAPDIQDKIHDSLEKAKTDYDSCRYIASFKTLDTIKKFITKSKSDSSLYKDSLLKIYNNRGRVNRILGKYSDAWDDFQNSLKINKKNYSAYRGLGVCSSITKNVLILQWVILIKHCNIKPIQRIVLLFIMGYLNLI